MAGKPNEIVITRVYDAPVKLVWEAWTDLNQIEKWWGPRGFTLTTKSKDLRPGGKWIYTMHGPDGTDYPNIATYHEVVKYEKLVYDHGGNEERPKLFTVTVTFQENKGKTTMTMISTLPTAAEAEAMKKFIKEANGTSTWDRLGEYLEQEIAGSDVFFINREFAGDLKSVFNMWASPENFARWLGPAGSTMKFLRADVREGGSSLWAMTDATGDTKHGTLHYRMIRPHEIFTYAQNFSDQQGNPCKAPFSPSYPDTILTTTSFREDGPDETLVTVRWEIIGNATDQERRTFHEMKSLMTMGWGQSFDKIDALLAAHK